jgi:hypothetical protein
MHKRHGGAIGLTGVRLAAAVWSERASRQGAGLPRGTRPRAAHAERRLVGGTAGPARAAVHGTRRRGGEGVRRMGTRAASGARDLGARDVRMSGRRGPDTEKGMDTTRRAGHDGNGYIPDG